MIGSSPAVSNGSTCRASVRNVRPKLLVSVRDVSEAEIALTAGAEWIDLKEPLAGPLGAVDVETARIVVEFVANRCPVSAALGELSMWQDPPVQRLLEVPGIDVVKLGLAACGEAENWSDDWLAAQRAIHQAGKSLVAVVYADWQRARSPAPEQIISLAGRSNCEYLLIDTFDKSAEGTLSCLGLARLSNLLRLAKRVSLRTVVAGRITLEDVFRLPTASLDVVAVRGGVCSESRSGQVDRRLVAEFHRALAGHWSK